MVRYQRQLQRTALEGVHEPTPDGALGCLMRQSRGQML